VERLDEALVDHDGAPLLRVGDFPVPVPARSSSRLCRVGHCGRNVSRAPQPSARADVAAPSGVFPPLRKTFPPGETSRARFSDAFASRVPVSNPPNATRPPETVWCWYVKSMYRFRRAGLRGTALVGTAPRRLRQHCSGAPSMLPRANENRASRRRLRSFGYDYDARAPNSRKSLIAAVWKMRSLQRLVKMRFDRSNARVIRATRGSSSHLRRADRRPLAVAVAEMRPRRRRRRFGRRRRRAATARP